MTSAALVLLLFLYVLVGCNTTVDEAGDSDLLEHVSVEVFQRNQIYELPCGVGSHLQNVTWTKNAQSLDTANSTLVITDLIHGDSGLYSCESCDGSECFRRTVQLDVTYRIRGNYMKNRTVTVGKNARLDCVPRILARYRCKVRIYKVEFPAETLSDLKNFTDENKLNRDFGLELDSVGYDVVGWYTCVVTIVNKSQQEVPLAFKSAYLNVSEKEEVLEETLEQEEPVSALTIAAIVVGVLFVLMILVFLLYRQSILKQKYYDRWVKVVSVTTLKNTESDTFQMPIVSIQKLRSVVVVNKNYESVSNNEYEFPIDEDWEFPRNKLTLGKELGEGAFGKVIMAEAEGLFEEETSTPVAVKMLKEEHTDNDVKDLICELEIMKIIGRHPNIVNLLGSCTQVGPLYVIVEFAAHGNLKSFLPNHNLTTSQLVNFANQIALGMQHLSSMKLIHRDLAARNVLVSEGFTMKIADFGLARDIHNQDYYRKTTAGKLPIRWMAPESLEKMFFDTKSDVWSFGVLLWEIMTLGRNPYSWINGWEFMLEFLRRGNRLDQPVNCPNEIYEIMKECWQFEANDRPNFELITKSIECFSLELELAFCEDKNE